MPKIGPSRGCHTFIEGDVCDPVAVAAAMSDVDAVVHARPRATLRGLCTRRTTSCRRTFMAHGSCWMLRFAPASIGSSTSPLMRSSARRHMAWRSTPRPRCAQATPMQPSKVGAEALVHALAHTHGYPAAIVRCTNNYGPRQHPGEGYPVLDSRGFRAAVRCPSTAKGRRSVIGCLWVTSRAGYRGCSNRWQDQATWHLPGSNTKRIVGWRVDQHAAWGERA